MIYNGTQPITPAELARANELAETLCDKCGELPGVLSDGSCLKCDHLAGERLDDAIEYADEETEL